MTTYIGLFMMFFTSCGEKEDTSVTQKYIPTFSELESDIFGLSCAFSSCHGSGTGGLLLNGEDDFERLVDRESTMVAGEILVIPGDSAASYLIKKMRGSDDIFGDVMPPGGLDEEIVQSVANWIDAGAAKD